MSIEQKVESFFQSVLASIQVGKIYTCDHPRFGGYLDKAYQEVTDILSSREEIVIGIVGDELAFEKEIFFDLSKRVKVVIEYLKSKGIERIAFYRQLTKDELKTFIVFLMSQFDEKKISVDKYLTDNGVHNIVVGKIGAKDVTASDKGIGSKQVLSYIENYQTSAQKVSTSFESLINSESIDALDLKFTVARIMENLVGRYVEFFKLAVVKEYDTSTFSHVLNVSILSMYFSAYLGFSRDDCLEIGIAGLFHDIGKVYISRKIIQKTDKLTDAEFSSVRSHTVLGAEILLKYVDTLGILPVVVAFEHHLKYNLEGYPKLPFKQPIHIASQIVSLCDVYDALTQRRSYKRDYPPEMIYDLMQRERGGLFSPELLDKFFNAIGFWPNGTILRMEDESVAIVRSQNKNDFRRPNVEIIYPVPSPALVELHSRPGIKIRASLNPLNEGKDYVSFI